MLVATQRRTAQYTFTEDSSDVFLVDFVVPRRTRRSWRRGHRNRTALRGKNL